MAHKNLKQFKGLAQHVAFEELSHELCHTLSNLDVDNPIGKLTLRGGYSKKFTDAFNGIINAYEYEYPASGDTILLFNDNGTLKYYTNGGSLTSLSLPSGAALEADFRNQFFGFKDHILITTGNGSTNFVLGFYYLKRVNASNTGLFGNNEEFTGYKLLKSQLISRHGTFSRVYSVADHGSFFYISFKNSKWIEKRDNNWQLVERFIAHPDADDEATISLDSDGTNIFMGVSDAANSQDGLYRIDPNGWTVEEFENLADVVDVAVDDAQVYSCQASPSSALRAYLKGNFAAGQQSADTSSFDGVAVACFNSGGSHIYTIRDASGTPTVERRDETAVGTVTHTYNTLTDANHLECTSNVWVTDVGADEIKELDAADITLQNTYTHATEPDALFTVSGDGLKIFSEHDGIMVDDSTATLYRPDFITLNVESINGSGSLGTGTYFYKISIIDVDGQEFTLSDPVIATFSSSSNVDIHIVANETELDDFYRVQTINVYRAYNSDVDAEAPSTNYKFLRAIDINEAGWQNNSTLSFYYYDFTDSTTEANISSVTFLENAGFSENTKPRFVNYKVHEWIGNQLHAANFYVDGTTYKNKVAKSQFNGPDVLPFANTYDFDPYDGDEIINITTAYSRAYVMKSRVTGVFFNDVLERRIRHGLADTDSYYTDGDLIYLMSDKAIVEINGSNVKQLQDNVITSFESISSFTDATVFHRDDFDRFWFVIPQSKVLVWSRKHNVYTEYSSAYAFRGYFKNLANEYIGFGNIPGDIHFFVDFDDSTQDIEDDIQISYESPLMRLDGVDGFHSELTQLYYRQKSTGTFTLKIYDWRQDSKATALTLTLTDLTTISTIVKHLQDIWGESFSIELTGQGTVFEFASLSLFYETAGLAEEMHS